MGAVTRFVVYIPNSHASGVRAKALRQYPSVSAYLKSLVDQDQGTKPDPVRTEIDRLSKRLDEVLQFSKYIMVVQNATAERLSPGLMAEVEKLYLAETGSAPDAR